MGYSLILLGYAFLSSVLPVWLLLQPRDYLNSLLLYLGLILLVVAIIFYNPAFVAPAIRLTPKDAPPLFPFVFIIIACGSVSGFHALVGSGTTAKQLNKESDARLIGYGGMLGESLLGVIAVLATTASVGTTSEWLNKYESFNNVQGLSVQVGGFIQGATIFLAQIGINKEIATCFMSVVVVSFALTSLDSATRLLRYNLEEIFETLKLRKLNNRYISSILAVLSIAFFAFYRLDGKPAGLMLWSLFGTTNQILAGLTLMVIGCYLMGKTRILWPVLVPMFLVMATTFFAMLINLLDFFKKGQLLLFFVGLALLIMAVFLMVETIIHFAKNYWAHVAKARAGVMD